MKKRPQTGFTLIEILIVIGIMAVLATILFPAFEQARMKERSKATELNIRQISYGIIQYMQDNEEKGPRSGFDCQSHRTAPKSFSWHEQNQCGGDGWQDVVAPYIKSKRIFVSPDDDSDVNGPPTGPADLIAKGNIQGRTRWHVMGNGSDFTATDGRFSFLMNDMLSHKVPSRNANYPSEGYADVANDERQLELMCSDN